MDSEDDLQSLVRQARAYGLSYDPELDSDDELEERLIAAYQIPSCLDDPEDVPRFGPSNDFSHREKYPLDADARRFLASVINPQHSSTASSSHLDVRRAKYLKVEPPLLWSDSEADVKDFVTARIDEKELDVNDLPRAVVRIEQDEGLAWPTKYQDLPAEIDKRIRDEKLLVPRESLLLLQEARSPKLSKSVLSEMFEHELKYKRNKALNPLTPLLLPDIPESSSPTTSSPVPYLNLMAGPSTPDPRDAQSLHASLMEDDDKMLLGEHDRLLTMSTNTDELEQLYSPLRQRPEKGKDSSSSPPMDARERKFKLEQPLSPVYQSPMPQSDELHIDKLPAWEDRSDLHMEEDDLDKAFDKYIQRAALSVQETISNERLHEADATMRLPVPEVNFTTSPPLWLEHVTEKQEEQEIHEMMLPIAQNKLHHWHTSKIENEVIWRPFPLHLGIVNLQEEIKNHGLVDQFIKLDMSRGIDRDSLTWKPDGLRILDDHEDEDELSDFGEGELNEHSNMQSLLRSRMLGMTSNVTKPNVEPIGGLRAQVAVPREDAFTDFFNSVNHIPLALPQPQTAPVVTADNRIHGDLFSASEQLDRFMDMQGQQRKRRKIDPPTIDKAGNVVESTAGVNVPQLAPVNGDPEINYISQPLPKPIILHELPPRQVIASTRVTSNLHLFRHITKLYPDLDIIERDYTLHKSIDQQGHSLAKHLPTSDEADLILSPSTGILMTSLAHLHQKPLPGTIPSSSAAQAGHAIHTRITTIAAYYGRLIVLVTSSSAPPSVSTTNAPPIALPDTRDIQAVASLITFAASLAAEADIDVVFVPGGLEETATWIVALIAGTGQMKNATTMMLMQDETWWELWLRRAGLNPWAAQVVIATLKDGIEGLTGLTGLRAFIAMQAEERVRVFRGLLGGERVLRRVEEVLDEALDDDDA